MIHAASPEKGTGGSYAYRIELMAKQIRELFGTLPDNLEGFYPGKPNHRRSLQVLYIGSSAPESPTVPESSGGTS